MIRIRVQPTAPVVFFHLRDSRIELEIGKETEQQVGNVQLQQRGSIDVTGGVRLRESARGRGDFANGFVVGKIEVCPDEMVVRVLKNRLLVDPLKVDAVNGV